MIWRLLAGGVVALLVVAALGHGAAQQQRHEQPRSTPAPLELEHEVVNSQDRVDAAHRRREARAFDSRRLLSALPIEHAGVRIDIAGLDAEGRMTVVSISAGTRGRTFAREVYRRALVAHGDPGTAYRIRWER